MKAFPDIACREFVSQSLGTPLERVDSARVMGAWAEARELPYGLSLEKYNDDTWDCFTVAGWLVEAAIWEDDWEHKWALKLRAVPQSRWVQLAQLLGDGPSWVRPFASVAPTLRHPLFGPDWTVRHRGGPWGRETTREFKSLDEAAVRAAAAQWTSQFVDDLPQADRWIKGEHRDSDALVSGTWLRLKPSRQSTLIFMVPRDSEDRPTFRNVVELGDQELTDVGRKSRFGRILKEFPPVWDLMQPRSGELLSLSVPHFDMLSEKDMAATADVLDRMESDFWIYELRAMGPYSGDDLRDFWRQWMSDDTSADDDAVGVAVAVDLQLVIAPRARSSFDEISERLDETVAMCDEGAFAGLLGDATVWDGEEAATGDALLIEIPKGRRVSQEDVAEIEALLSRCAGRFEVYETRTTDPFTREDLHEWWQEAQDLEVSQ